MVSSLCTRTATEQYEPTKDLILIRVGILQSLALDDDPDPPAKCLTFVADESDNADRSWGFPQEKGK